MLILVLLINFLGAECINCTATKAQVNDPEYAENNWYLKDRSRDQNLELYQSVKKKKNGQIDTTVPTDERKNITKKPMGVFLDWTG